MSERNTSSERSKRFRVLLSSAVERDFSKLYGATFEDGNVQPRYRAEFVAGGYLSYADGDAGQPYWSASLSFRDASNPPQIRGEVADICDITVNGPIASRHVFLLNPELLNNGEWEQLPTEVLVPANLIRGMVTMDPVESEAGPVES